jgi:hypothetical protein
MSVYIARSGCCTRELVQWRRILQIGVDICTLPEIVYNTNRIHFFCVSSVLLGTDLTYSHVPGDQGGPIFSDLRFFFGGHFTYKLVYYNLYFGYKFISERVRNYLQNCRLQISTYQFVYFFYN